jgi:triphosphatase
VDGAFEQPQPATVFEVSLDRDVSAERAFQVIGRSCVDQLQANERAVLQSRAPEAVHQMRVALRRWRTALSVFRGLFEDRGAGIRHDLEWLAGELDDARDLDVFSAGAMACSDIAKSHPAAFAALEAAVSRAKARAYDRAAAAIGSDRYRKLLWEGARAIETLSPSGDHGEPPPSARDMARRALRHQRKAIKTAGARLTKLDPPARHRLRIRVKKARYTAEMFGDLFKRPKRQRRFGRALKGLQDALGELNDIHVAEDLALRLAQDADAPEAGFAAGLIVNARAPSAKTLLARSVRAYDRFRGAEPFW